LRNRTSASTGAVAHLALCRLFMRDAHAPDLWAHFDLTARISRRLSPWT
jgi:hypothetical protein